MSDAELHVVFGTGQVGRPLVVEYQFQEPFVLNTTKYQSTFGAAGTPLATAIADTLTWYRNRAGTP